MWRWKKKGEEEVSGNEIWGKFGNLEWNFDFDKQKYRIVSNKRPGGVAIFQKGDVYKRQVFNAKIQCLSLFTMTHRREI